MMKDSLEEHNKQVALQRVATSIQALNEADVSYDFGQACDALMQAAIQLLMHWQSLARQE